MKDGHSSEDGHKGCSLEKNCLVSLDPLSFCSVEDGWHLGSGARAEDSCLPDPRAWVLLTLGPPEAGPASSLGPRSADSPTGPSMAHPLVFGTHLPTSLYFLMVLPQRANRFIGTAAR